MKIYSQGDQAIVVSIEKKCISKTDRRFTFIESIFN